MDNQTLTLLALACLCTWPLATLALVWYVGYVWPVVRFRGPIDRDELR